MTKTVRTVTHRGREIRIETTYKVTIDGEPLKGMLEVLGDGRVHYHGLPQYALPSAVEMLRRVVDHFGFKPPVADELGAHRGGTAMTVTRRNILESADAHDRYLQAVVELNRADTGVTAGDLYQQLRSVVPLLRMSGLNQELSVWDLFVIWHYLAMQIVTPPLQPLRNLAHGGPIFLPWHRMYLIRLEEQLQRVTDADTALPYWDWAAHGELSETAQREGELWSERYLGESRGEVTSGPLGDMRVRIEDRGDRLYSIPERRLLRNAGGDTPKLPTLADLRWTLEDKNY